MGEANKPRPKNRKKREARCAASWPGGQLNRCAGTRATQKHYVPKDIVLTEGSLPACTMFYLIQFHMFYPIQIHDFRGRSLLFGAWNALGHLGKMLSAGTWLGNMLSAGTWLGNVLTM